MKKYPRHLTATIPIPVLIVTISMAALLLVMPASAGSVHGEGPGWKFNATETSIIDPTTGMPFPSMGALDRALYPGLWDAMSSAAKTLADNTPAISRSFDISYALNASQQAISEQVETRSVTEAQYLSAVLPDLWAAIPAWQKEQYQNEPHHALSVALPSTAGQFTGPFFGASGSFPSSFDSYTTGFTPVKFNSAAGNAAGFWLSFGNTGNGAGVSENSWLSPGQISGFPSTTFDVTVVPVEGTWQHNLPFSSNEAGGTAGMILQVPAMNPFKATGLSHEGGLFPGPGRTSWPAF
jgi:hypothetical protein